MISADPRVEITRHSGWSEGGLSWFQDLTVPDPFYVLPVANTVLLLYNIEVGMKPGVPVPEEEKRKGTVESLLMLLQDPRMVDYIKVGISRLPEMDCQGFPLDSLKNAPPCRLRFKALY